jgi:co-chaperonin GroES (HSP10)
MIKPRKNHVLVKRDEYPTEEITQGGIVVPAVSLLNRPLKQTGRIVEVGPDVRGLDKHDHILFPQHAGHQIIYDNELYIMLTEDLIIALIQDEVV